jgi:hypothetical protein
MMLDDASRCGAHDCVMARDVTYNPTDGRAFQTAFGGSDPWKRREGRGDQENDHNVAHMKLLRPTGADKTPHEEESCRLVSRRHSLMYRAAAHHPLA